MGLAAKKTIAINAKIKKVKELLPPELSSKRKRLEFIKNKLAIPVTKKERHAEAKAITKKLKHDVWNWTTALDKAAFYVAENKLSPKEIKAKTSVSPERIKKMLHLNGEFASRVQHYRQTIMDKIVNVGIGNKNTRIAVLDDIHEKMVDIIHSRRRKYINRKHPGVDTGLMIRTVKAVGHGAKTKIVRGWDFDKDLVKEIRDTQQQIAKELGQWTEKTENSNMVLVREYGGADPNDV